MEDALNFDLFKSIGVSNFDIPLFQSLVHSAHVFPAMNQVESHPRLNQQLNEFWAQYKIRLTAYSLLGVGLLICNPVIVLIGQNYNNTFIEIKVKDINVFSDSLFISTLRYDHNSPLNLPPDHNLCRSLVVLLFY